MQTMKASEFKARCLKLMDEINRSGEEVVITKNGVPVSRLVPCRPASGTLFGRHRGQVDITGDIIGPVDEKWDADAAD